jgi:hypothetical protein
VRKITVNGRDTAEWVYTVTELTSGYALEVTVSYYITKVAEQYVYLTFSLPSAQYTGARGTIESTLATFSAPQSQPSYHFPLRVWLQSGQVTSLGHAATPLARPRQTVATWLRRSRAGGLDA